MVETIPDLLTAWAGSPRGSILGDAPVDSERAVEEIASLARGLQTLAARADPATSRPVIAYDTPPGSEGMQLFLAASWIGVAAPIRPNLTPQERAAVIARVAPDLDLPLEALDFEHLRVTGGSGPAPSAPPPDALALLLTTSGTTGPPKRVALDHRRLSVSAQNIASWFQLTEADRALTVMPLFHIHGLVAGVLAPIAAGGSLLPVGFDAFAFGTLAKRHHTTWCSAVPSMWELVLARWETRGDELRHGDWRFVRTSSSALPPTLMRRIEATLGVPCLEAYGMTEASHQIAANPLPPHERVAGSVGCPTGDVQIRIQALEGEREGQVQVRGSTIVTSYLDDPEATEAAFGDGWFATGDQGRLEDGRLHLTGRISEFINRGGDKISPHEIEGVIAQHPDVDRVVAFPMLHDRLGQVPGVAVVLRPEAAADAAAVAGFARDALSRAKRPERLEVVDTWPLGPTGKLQRRFLAGQLGWE